ncbi:hypothetical protein [Flavobacterium soyangense]|uniref:Lipocalin-like domain-containing protein n=1 Tax=Flavobacterium soyangense TaxID=2023265 RepID=A0A930U6V6_9FLAO|nr:hypothetical protein [Flavobacterium soyangense]MBF2708008.1 hypothetical protein [Flavobacterium soyangense]
MKKISILFVSALTLVMIFTSCTKDDSGSVDLNLIGGKWVFNKSTATSIGITIPYSTSYFKNEDGCNKDYIDFLTGGAVKYGDYSLNCVFNGRDGTWTQSGNTVTINVTSSSFNGTFNVASLNTTELILKIDGTYGGKSGTFNLYFTR